MEEENITFEESLKELEEIVSRLEKGDVPLEEAIEEFSKAMKLVKYCDDKLNEARTTIAKIVDENGEIIEFNVDN